MSKDLEVAITILNSVNFFLSLTDQLVTRDLTKRNFPLSRTHSQAVE